MLFHSLFIKLFSNKNFPILSKINLPDSPSKADSPNNIIIGFFDFKNILLISVSLFTNFLISSVELPAIL